VSFANVVETVHALPGRLRFRYRPLRGDADETRAGAIADALVRAPGVRDVSVTPATGSVVVVFDPERVAPARLTRLLQETTRAERVCALGEDAPSRPPVPREPSKLALAAARFFEEINEDVRSATDGQADLATLMPVGFVGLGIAEVAASRELPAPPWWSLFWWSFRSFLSLNDPAISAASSAGRSGSP
jgi:hypothetical protein